MTDLARAQSLLVGERTCVLVKGDTVVSSDKKGIAPMMGFLAEGRDLRGFSVADRIVGKAAAMLFVKAGVTAVYAEVLSAPGKAYLEAHGTYVTYGTLTERIINRAGTGLCPMEETVSAIEDAEEGYQALGAKIAAMRAAAH